MEFCNDIDTKAKYYALMDWVNQISKTSIEPSEFEEKHNYLFHEYLNQYRIHKMKFKKSVVKVIINGTAEFFGELIDIRAK